MPLVTRLANQGVFFKQAAEPSDWQNGDIWIDTDNSNVYVNQGGTAVRIALGSVTRGDVLYASADDTIQRLAKGTSGQYLQIGANDPSWVTLSSPLELLNSQKLTGTAGTITYTPGAALDLVSTYSEIIVFLVGQISATGDISIKTNAHTTYDTSHIRNTAGTLTGRVGSSEGGDILVSGVLTAADYFVITFRVRCNPANSILYTSGDAFVPGKGHALATIKDLTSATTLTSFQVLAGATTFAVNTEMVTYGVKR